AYLQPEKVCGAVGDVGSIHKRLVPGFVADCRMEGDDARIVTLGNGLVIKEIICARDEASRRLCCSAKSERLMHHNASLQIFADGPGTKAGWIADLLPNEAPPAIGAIIDRRVRPVE